MSTINEELTYLEETKQQIKQAIIDKGQEISEEDSFRSYVDKIEAIESGGTPVSVEEKDVNFYDYDGTRLYSYTLTEVQNLTELPALPSHSGLTCQGWNWTLADIKAEGKETDVGAMYITDDGKTRLYIEVPTNVRTTVSLCFRQSVANGVEVDWGDGSAIETFSDSGNTDIVPSHTYSNLGEYTITLNPLNNCQLSLGNETTSYNVLGNLSNMLARNCLHKVCIGRNAVIMGYAFYLCRFLKSVTIPNNIIAINSYAFYGIQSSVPILILPSSMSTLSDRIFNNTNIKRIILPNTINYIGIHAFSLNLILSKLTIPKNVNTIKTYAFYSCSALVTLEIPANVTTIEKCTFQSCVSVAIYDFSSHTSIPTLSNVDAFSSISSDCKIIVPDALYDDWIAATNWSTYASYIMKKSDWEASQV